MRVRLTVLLIALLAIAVMPSEAALVEYGGSVVDQVTSCTEPSGLVRELGTDAVASVPCRPQVPTGAAASVLGVLLALAAGLGVMGPAAVRVRRRTERWCLPAAVACTGAPWRAPPVGV